MVNMRHQSVRPIVTPLKMFKRETHSWFVTKAIRTFYYFPRTAYDWNSFFVHVYQSVLQFSTVTPCLKAVDTIGNCQRLAFTVGVSQHKLKVTNLWKFEPNWSSNLQDNNERKKNTLVTRSCVRIDGWFRKKHPCWTNLFAFRYE